MADETAKILSLKDFRALGSTLLQRLQLAARAGLAFDSARDYYKIFGWKRTLTIPDFRAKYERQDIAKAIIDRPADAVWSDPPKIKINNEVSAEWEELVENFNLWTVFERIDRLTALGEYGILLLGTDDGRRLEDEVTSQNLQLTYVQPHGQWNVSIRELDVNTNSARFSLPTMYELNTPELATRTSGAAPTPRISAPLRVHHTRVIHTVDALLDDNVFGTPRLQAVYNALDDLLKVSGGTAEAFWLEGRGGLQVDVDKEMDLKPEDAAALEDEIEEYVHNLRRFMRTRGVTAKQLGGDPPSPDATFKMLVSLISASTGIPQRVLLGSEAGQLASSQDRTNWAERVMERQRTFAGPGVLRPFVTRMQQWQILPTGPIQIEWPDAYRQNPLEKGQAMAQQARAAVNYSRQAEKGNPITSKEEARRSMGLPDQIPEGETPFEVPEPAPTPFPTDPQAQGQRGDRPVRTPTEE